VGATSVPRQLIRILKGKKQMKIASFLAMTTILIARGRKQGRQHKNGCHCEEERRGNLPYFYTRLTGCTHLFLSKALVTSFLDFKSIQTEQRIPALSVALYLEPEFMSLALVSQFNSTPAYWIEGR